jgi:Phosphotransferase enzyme family
MSLMRLRYPQSGTRHVLAGMRQVREYSRQLLFASEARRAVAEILPTLPPANDLPSTPTWTINQILSTTNDAQVLSLSAASNGVVVAVLKVSSGSQAADSMRRESEVLRCLAADPRLEELHPVLPAVIGCGQTRNHSFLLLKPMPGLDARTVISGPAAVERFQAAASAIVSLLHQRTAIPAVVDRTLTDRWVDQPIQRVRDLGGEHRAIARISASIDGLATDLRKSLLGKRLTLSRVHGDFSPGNLRMSPDGGGVTGVVDWENSNAVDLPMLDLVQLILSTRVEREHSELGDVLRRLVNVAGLAPHEARILDTAQSCLGGDTLDFRDLLVLTWLRHVSDNLTRSSDLNRHRWWVRKNIESVLARL